MQGNIVIISGPSGAGKSSLCKKLFAQIDNIYFSISSTTRAKRDGEVDGVHYHFISQDEFINGIEAGFFLEWAKVHDNYYGTGKQQVENALSEGKIVLFDIDVQGHKSLKNHYPHAVSIFITTPNPRILESRLKARALDSEAIIAKRLESAYREIQDIHLFDYVIINDNLDVALEGFLSIVKSLPFRNNDMYSGDILRLWDKEA